MEPKGAVEFYVIDICTKRINGHEKIGLPSLLANDHHSEFLFFK